MVDERASNWTYSRESIFANANDREPLLHVMVPLHQPYPRASPGTAINQANAVSIITGAVFNVDIFCRARWGSCWRMSSPVYSSRRSAYTVEEAAQVVEEHIAPVVATYLASHGPRLARARGHEPSG